MTDVSKPDQLTKAGGRPGGPPNGSAESLPSPKPPSSRRLRRLLLVMVLILATLEALYLAGANYFLNSERARGLINRQPEKLEVSWRGGYSLVPGVARIWEVELRGQNRTIQWWTELDRVTVHAALLPLAGKRFHARRIRGRGLAFRIRPRLAPDGSASADERWPPIPGLANPDGEIPPEPPPPPADPWRVELDNIDVREVREVWLGAQHYAGDGRVEGDVELVVRGPLEVERATLALGPGELRAGEELVASGLELELEATIEPFVPGEVAPLEVLRQITAGLVLRAERAGFGFLEPYLRGTPWLELAGDGRLDVELELARGVLRPGSRLTVAEADVAVDYLDFKARGAGRLTGSVEGASDAGGSTRTTLEARLDEFELRRHGAAEAHVAGRGLVVRATGGELDFAASEAPVLDVLVELPRSEIRDFGLYNAYLPPNAGLAIRSGHGTIEGWLRLSAAAPEDAGEIRLRGREILAAFGERQLLGNLELVTRLADADPASRRFTLVDTTLAFEDVALIRDGERIDEDWWARIAIARGEVAFTEPLSLSASLTARVRDSRPLLALAAQRKPLLGWMKPMLRIRDLELESRVRIAGDDLVLEELSLRGKGLEVLADLYLADPPRGVLYVDRGPLSAAIVFDRDGRDWKLIGARKWFERQRRLSSAAGR